MNLEEFMSGVRRIREELQKEEEKNKSQQGTTNAATFKIPAKHYDFCKKNPVFTKVVGKGMVTIAEMMKDLERIKGFLTSDTTLGLVQDGTKDEARDFLFSCFESLVKGNMKTYYGVSEEQYEEMKSRLRGKQIECDLGDIN